MILICDYCGEQFDSEDYDFCPNCGSVCVREKE